MANLARISKESEFFIHELTVMTGKNKIEIIEDALRSFNHHERMRLLDESFENLKKDKKAWNEELEERVELEGTLSDGLNDD